MNTRAEFTPKCPLGRAVLRMIPRAAVVAVLTSAVAAGSSDAARGVDAGLHTFLLGSGEQPGFVVHGRPIAWTNSRAFLRHAVYPGTQVRATDLKALRRDGFVATVWRGLRGAGGHQGFSEVIEFRRPSGAQHAARLVLKLDSVEPPGVRIKPFTIAGLSSARGSTAEGDGAAVANVMWVEGRCILSSGLALPHAGTLTTAAIAAPVIAGAESLSRRTGASCP